MARSKVEMLAEMTALETEMRSTLTTVKIDENRLSVPEGSEKLRADFIRPGHHWLVALHGNEFKLVQKAREFCTEEVWEMYEILGEDDLVEVRDLRKALNVFRMAVISRKRPDFYKTTKRSKLLKAAK
jgi:hypothetical protein